MPSPFPGMDPYLEEDKLWPAFHHQLIAGLYQMLLPGLVDRYRARIGQRNYITEEPLFTSIIRQEHHEEFIEIRQRSDSRFITLIDIPSPANKMLPEGRKAYLETRRQARSQGGNAVEIDLLLQGSPLLDFNREGLPDWDYAVAICRSSHPDKFEIYTSTLSKRLPRFKVPLASDDRDTVLDLQSTFSRAFDLGNFLGQIDYTRDPGYRITDPRLKVISDWLTQMKLRSGS